VPSNVVQCCVVQMLPRSRHSFQAVIHRLSWCTFLLCHRHHEGFQCVLFLPHVPHKMSSDLLVTIMEQACTSEVEIPIVEGAMLPNSHQRMHQTIAIGSSLLQLQEERAPIFQFKWKLGEGVINRSQSVVLTNSWIIEHFRLQRFGGTDLALQANLALFVDTMMVFCQPSVQARFMQVVGASLSLTQSPHTLVQMLKDAARLITAAAKVSWISRMLVGLSS